MFGGGGEPMAQDNRPHPMNVPGPFYVLNGCCTACDVPVSEAPDLFTGTSQAVQHPLRT